MKDRYIIILFFSLIALSVNGQDTIFVDNSSNDISSCFQSAIDKARLNAGRPTVVKFISDDYQLSRDKALALEYFISNTTSELEQPIPLRHIGLFLKDIKNVTIDGSGAYFHTLGAITTFGIDNCENITLKNFTVDAIDPTVVEMNVVECDSLSLVLALHRDVKYCIENNNILFFGQGWMFKDGIAQLYNPKRDETWRCPYPFVDVASIDSIGPSIIKVNYITKKPECNVGDVYQLRDGLRTEVCGMVNNSKNVQFENLSIGFTGNFGIVSQMSENLSFNNVSFEPLAGRDHTCAGFADFLQISGCRGNVDINNCRFVGAHDDAINVHGTHLRVIEQVSPTKLKVRYMHPQTYGITPFLVGDSVEMVNAHSLLSIDGAKITNCEMVTPREWQLSLDKKIEINEEDEIVVENVSATPEVEIRHCYFSRIPTRGILVSTRRKVVIEYNIFFRMQMSAILIADDARSWFESGPVKDVTIKGNEFIECGEPVILIAPENDINMGAVHEGISIINNRFVMRSSIPISVKSTDNFKMVNNIYLNKNFNPIEITNFE